MTTTDWRLVHGCLAPCPPRALSIRVVGVSQICQSHLNTDLLLWACPDSCQLGPFLVAVSLLGGSKRRKRRLRPGLPLPELYNIYGTDALATVWSINKEP